MEELGASAQSPTAKEDSAPTRAPGTVRAVTEGAERAAAPDPRPGLETIVPVGPTPNYPIESVGNALKLLLMFRDESVIRVADASKALGVARSTGHRLFAMLQFYGFVTQDPVSRAYHAGPALIEVGLSVVGEMDIRSHARPLLTALRDEVDETVHLAIMSGGTDVVFLDSVEGTKSVRVGARIGQVMPAHVTSLGKAILAELPSDELRRLYPSKTLPGETENAKTTRAELEANLAEVRANGYATNFGESEPDLSAVGVAIHDRLGRVRGAISVSAPGGRINESRIADIADIAEPAKRAAEKIGQALA